MSTCQQQQKQKRRWIKSFLGNRYNRQSIYTVSFYPMKNLLLKPNLINKRIFSLIVSYLYLNMRHNNWFQRIHCGTIWKLKNSAWHSV